MATLIPSTNVDNTAELIQKLPTNASFSPAPMQQPAGTTGIASSSVAQPGFFGWLGNAWDGITGFFNGLGNRAQQVGNNIAGLSTATAPTNAATPVITNNKINPSIGLKMGLDFIQPDSTSTPIVNNIQAQTPNQNLFGWSDATWNNINKAKQIGQFGWNTYANWKQIQMAEDALAEQQAMNAYNRSLSTFNTNTQIEQANQSLRDRLYARQKYETGSTEGAEQLYKERELQKFRG